VYFYFATLARLTESAKEQSVYYWALRHTEDEFYKGY